MTATRDHLPTYDQPPKGPPQINDRSDVIAAANRWLESQPDTVACPLGGRLTLTTCKKRQDHLPHYIPINALESEVVEYTFSKCAALNCEHYKPPKRRAHKIPTKEIAIRRTRGRHFR